MTAFSVFFGVYSIHSNRQKPTRQIYEWQHRVILAWYKTERKNDWIQPV